MLRQRNSQEFNELERLWYEKLRNEGGFRDIENLSDPERRLITWDGWMFVKPAVQFRQAKRTQYQIQIDNFANSSEFPEILERMVRHGNSKFPAVQIEVIWEKHRAGFTEQGICEDMECSKSCIHFILKRMREWMRLIV